LGTLNSGSATTTITTAKDETIGLGLATGDMTIDGTELSHITAATLVVGSATTTGITVDGVAASESQNIGLASLNALAAGGTISFVNNDSTFQSLTAPAKTDTTFPHGPRPRPPTANTEIPCEAGRARTAAPGSLRLTAQTGSISDPGALTLDAKNGIT